VSTARQLVNGVGTALVASAATAIVCPIERVPSAGHVETFSPNETNRPSAT
jgi:hypothetical protein